MMPDSGCRVGTPKDIVLRQATDADFDLTFAIKKAAGGGYIRDVFGWDEEIQLEFHKRQFSPEHSSLILLDGKAVGWISVFDRQDFAEIDEFYVLPELQNRGIGTSVLAKVILHTRRRAVALCIRVFKINDGARRLYERLGFRAREEQDGPFLHMALVPSPQNDTPNETPHKTDGGNVQ